MPPSSIFYFDDETRTCRFDVFFICDSIHRADFDEPGDFCLSGAPGWPLALKTCGDVATQHFEYIQI